MSFEKAFERWQGNKWPQTSKDDAVDSLIKDIFGLESVWLAGIFVSYAKDRRVQKVEPQAVDELRNIKLNLAKLLADKPSERETLEAINAHLEDIEATLNAYIAEAGIEDQSPLKRVPKVTYSEFGSAQNIKVLAVDPWGKRIEESGINFAGVQLAAQEAKNCPWISSIDEYSYTYFNSRQIDHLLEELDSLKLSDDLQNVADKTKEFLKKHRETHVLVEFIGD